MVYKSQLLSNGSLLKEYGIVNYNETLSCSFTSIAEDMLRVLQSGNSDEEIIRELGALRDQENTEMVDSSEKQIISVYHCYIIE